MLLRYTESGYLVILPEDNPHEIVDLMLATNYDMEFCLSPDFSPRFIARLMEAGFLVMSTKLEDDSPGDNAEKGPEYILLPKLHLVRSALFYENLHIKKSIRRFLTSGEYELRFDSDFDYILNHCIAVHGDDWLTPPLAAAIKAIRSSSALPCGKSAGQAVYPVSFALYHGGKLVSGQFGVIAGRVYTGYSTYHTENNAGTIQLILSAQYLRDNGYHFFDMGMPLPYKNDLGAVDISPGYFVSLFRATIDKKE